MHLCSTPSFGSAPGITGLITEQDTLIRKSEIIADLEARLGAAGEEQLLTSAALRDALSKLQEAEQKAEKKNLFFGKKK